MPIRARAEVFLPAGSILSAETIIFIPHFKPKTALCGRLFPLDNESKSM
jgi:hypothetical protein